VLHEINTTNSAAFKTKQIPSSFTIHFPYKRRETKQIHFPYKRREPQKIVLESISRTREGIRAGAIKLDTSAQRAV